MLLFVLEMDIYYIRLRKTNHVAFVASLLDGEECRNEERDAPATRALFLILSGLFLCVAMDLLNDITILTIGIICVDTRQASYILYTERPK